MSKFILILLLLTSISFVIANLYTPIEITHNNFIPSLNNEKDMVYHTGPYYYYSMSFSKNVWACYFKPGDFGITGFNYRINIIGFIGYINNGPADIYVTSKEEGEFPACNPWNNWQGADYGPKHWHINNSYPNYDDCNVYDDDWHYTADVKKFWCLYYVVVGSPPYPFSDKPEDNKKINSAIWYTGSWKWGVFNYNNCNWCMHCVIVYWGSDIESTSLGVVKALFR